MKFLHLSFHIKPNKRRDEKGKDVSLENQIKFYFIVYINFNYQPLRMDWIGERKEKNLLQLITSLRHSSDTRVLYAVAALPHAFNKYPKNGRNVLNR